MSALNTATKGAQIRELTLQFLPGALQAAVGIKAASLLKGAMVREPEHVVTELAIRLARETAERYVSIDWSTTVMPETLGVVVEQPARSVPVQTQMIRDEDLPLSRDSERSARIPTARV